MNELNPDKTYTVKLATGYLRINVAPDPDYPGLDIDFIPDGRDENDERIDTHARVLIEQPINAETNTHDNVRVLVWADDKNEDYTHEIEFTDAQSNT